MNPEIAYNAIRNSALFDMMQNTELDDLADFFAEIVSVSRNESMAKAMVQGLIDTEIAKREQAIEAERKYQEVYR